MSGIGLKLLKYKYVLGSLTIYLIGILSSMFGRMEYLKTVCAPALKPKRVILFNDGKYNLFDNLRIIILKTSYEYTLLKPLDDKIPENSFDDEV